MEEKEPNGNSDTFEITDRGLRIINPFYTTLETFAKGRWIGKKLIDILCSEFPNYSKEYYEKKIASGYIKVNDIQAESSHTFKHKDKLQHKIHMHEPPVSSEQISILHSDEKLLVIDKPSSIPVHPTGKYRFNSILCILAKEYNFSNLHSVHRLDRLTSGILILAKNKEAAKEISNMFESGKIKKTYIAKVDGKFFSEEVKVEKSIQENKPRKGKNIVSEEGKLCTTVFKMLSYDSISNTSIVLCNNVLLLITYVSKKGDPEEGKNHQIRVHLSSLGYPISNDPLYGKGKRAKFQEKEKKGNEEHFDSDCPECLNPHSNPEEEQMRIFLHAYCYKSEKWVFKTKLPSWASQ